MGILTFIVQYMKIRQKQLMDLFQVILQEKWTATKNTQVLTWNPLLKSLDHNKCKSEGQRVMENTLSITLLNICPR